MTKKKSGFSKSELIFKVTRPGERASSRPRDSHHESASADFPSDFPRDSMEPSRLSRSFPYRQRSIDIIVERDLRQ